jgi:hypothetical protein
MLTIITFIGGAYVLYYVYCAGKRLGSQKGFAAGHRRRSMR